MYRNPSVLLIVILVFSVCMGGCNHQNDSSSFAEQKVLDTKQMPDVPLFEINAAVDQSEVEKFYGTKCESRSCVVQSDPSLAPLTKPKRIPLCKIPMYESKATSTLFFSNNGTFIGSNCEISEYDYQQVITSLGLANVYKRYLNQRGVLDLFQVWKSKVGYITTYRETVRGTPSGGIEYSYHLYVGFEEHPYYSQYQAD